jgi:hypothetical protein
MYSGQDWWRLTDPKKRREAMQQWGVARAPKELVEVLEMLYKKSPGLYTIGYIQNLTADIIWQQKNKRAESATGWKTRRKFMSKKIREWKAANPTAATFNQNSYEYNEASEWRCFYNRRIAELSRQFPSLTGAEISRKANEEYSSWRGGRRQTLNYEQMVIDHEKYQQMIRDADAEWKHHLANLALADKYKEADTKTRFTMYATKNKITYTTEKLDAAWNQLENFFVSETMPTEDTVLTSVNYILVGGGLERFILAMTPYVSKNFSNPDQLKEALTTIWSKLKDEMRQQFMKETAPTQEEVCSMMLMLFC